MKQQSPALLLGAHVSIAGGFEKAIEHGESINCTAIQIFTKSNRQWAAKAITPEEASRFIDAKKQSFIQSVSAHATYLINLGSPDSATQKKSITAVTDELDRCHMLDIPFLILHPGASLSSSEEDCLQRITDNLNEAMSKATGNTMVLLENMAGQGSVIGYKFEHLAFIRKNSDFKSKVGVCFDTCHAFAAGYDFSTPKSYETMWQEFDATIGLSHLKVIHINDSKKECDSKVDRHEDIGKGKLGLEPFRMLFNDPQWFNIPKILETPADDLKDYVRNMESIKSLILKTTRKVLNMDGSD
ncbi:MAG: deoxyribonuclease IV [Candidatus Dependentiae bacterium]|nr:deoxyribonuclease IV [Candidatus Dependentiae bacterium]